MELELTQVWQTLALAAQNVADAIHAKSKGQPYKHLLEQADERTLKAHLAIKKQPEDTDL